MIRFLPPMIRDCEKKDIPHVLEIEKLSFDDPYPESLFITFLERFPKGFRVAENKGLLVGYCVILPWKDRHTMVITSLAVHPDLKRKQIASNLLEDAISIARNNQEVTRILLQVSTDNLAAQQLYSKFGFVKTHNIKNYYGNGRDGIEMELSFNKAQFTHK